MPLIALWQVLTQEKFKSFPAVARKAQLVFLSVIPMVRCAWVTRQGCVRGEQPVSQAQKPCETHTGSGGHWGISAP